MNTLDSILKIVSLPACDSEGTFRAFKARLERGSLTRDEDPASHFCVYFLPYDAFERKVFVTHHKKSGLWLSPGGHMDKGETPLEALNREIDEELGVKDFFKEEPSPFLLTVTPIENQTQSCKTHYDVWYLVMTDGSDFNVDPAEFHDTKWLTVEEAEKIVTNEANIRALEIIKKL